MSPPAAAGAAEEPAAVTAAVDGRMVVVRRARRPEEVQALERQAAVLAACAGRGALELLSLHRDGDDLLLVAAAVDGPPLGAAGLSPAEVAGALAGLARALAALHLRGLAHGAVTLDNVRVRRSDGEAVLGLPIGDPGATPSPADDVAGLGTILLALAGDAPGDRLHRLRRRAADPSGDGDGAAATLRSVGAWAADPDPARRPGAEAVAAALERVAPARPVLGLSVPARAREAPGVNRWRRALPGAVLAATLVAAGALATRSLAAGGATPHRPAGPGRSAGQSPTATAPPVREPGCPPQPAGPAADVDGDGCGEPLTVDGTEVVAGDVRFALGRPGDVVVVGDWDCDGRASAAVLDPATGDVFVFDRWPDTPGGELTVTATASVAGAVAARAADVDGDGCDDLVLERRSGPPAVVRPAAGARPAAPERALSAGAEPPRSPAGARPG
jgi:hypothetical protein